MKKTILRNTLLSLAMMMSFIMVANAQTYEVVPLGDEKSDSLIQAYKYEAPSKGGTTLWTPGNFDLKKEAKIPRGALVSLKDKGVVWDTDGGFFSTLSLDPDKRPIASVTYEGKTYYVDPHELKFSETNPEGTQNPLAKYTDIDYRSYYSSRMIIRIFVMIILMWISCSIAVRIGRKKLEKGKLKPHNKWIALFLGIAILFALVVCVSEILCVVKMGKECGWWLNSGYVGDGLRFVNIFLLYFALSRQQRIINTFGDGMEYFLCTDKVVPRGEFLKMLIITVILFVVFMVAGLILYTRIHWLAITCFWIAGIAPLLIIIIGLLSTFLGIKEAGGWFVSIAYTLFIVLWSVATILLLGFFIWQFLRFIIPFLIITVFCQFMPTTSMMGPPSVSGMKFYDSNGGVHDNVMSRDLRNEALKSYE